MTNLSLPIEIDAVTALAILSLMERTETGSEFRQAILNSVIGAPEPRKPKTTQPSLGLDEHIPNPTRPSNAGTFRSTGRQCDQIREIQAEDGFASYNSHAHIVLRGLYCLQNCRYTTDIPTVATEWLMEKYKEHYDRLSYMQDNVVNTHQVAPSTAHILCLHIDDNTTFDFSKIVRGVNAVLRHYNNSSKYKLPGKDHVRKDMGRRIAIIAGYIQGWNAWIEGDTAISKIGWNHFNPSDVTVDLLTPNQQKIEA